MGGEPPVNEDVYTRFAALGVATVYEAAGRAGLIDVPLIQVVPQTSAAGPARTVACGQDDNLAVHAAIERIEPGEVLVLSMPEPRPVALLGELLAIQVSVRKAAAVLVDAAVRDYDELVRLGLPIWARFVRAKGATKTVAGALDAPVTVGGAEIRAGDLVVLDADGAVCVPAARMQAVLAAARSPGTSGRSCFENACSPGTSRSICTACARLSNSSRELRMAENEPVYDLAHLGHVELLTPTPDASLHFFVDIMGMTESARPGSSSEKRSGPGPAATPQ